MCRIAIDVTADTPQEAAKQAYDLLRDPEAQPWVVEVFQQFSNGQLYDRIVVDLSQIQAQRSDDADHEHQWGPLEQSRIAGTVHRKCQVPGCKVVNPYDDEEPNESEPDDRPGPAG